MKCFGAQVFRFWFLVGLVAASSRGAEVAYPFPQAGKSPTFGLHLKSLTSAQASSAVRIYYFYWKSHYLSPSTKVAGDYKVDFDHTGTTVSEAMGYGMLITAYMAGADTNARTCFDGLNRFRKRYPSCINPALMCWKIPTNEVAVRDDCATDGDLDMALALLLAHRQWGDAVYFQEATNLIQNIATALVRPDFSLRLGDWDTETNELEKTRPSDFMPAHFRVFEKATGDLIWGKVEARCYAVLEELQTKSAQATGLIPDFAVQNKSHWQPVKKKFLESKHDGDFSYNSCRVPWRIGWAATTLDDARARRILERLMSWVTSKTQQPRQFKSGYRLDGASFGGNYDSACFISPTGVAAMATDHQAWLDQTFAYGVNRQDGYYEDSVNLLCLLVMSGNAWLPDYSN
jgi:endoglucanase